VPAPGQRVRRSRTNEAREESPGNKEHRTPFGELSATAE